MNYSPLSVVAILDRLSIGVSRISIRHGHTRPKVKRPQPELTGFKGSLGERIWVHNHIVTGMIIYSHAPQLKRDSHKGLAQIPFTVKKQKPPVLREDYWTPLCLIEFPRGKGVVGRNVMQKLQEFRHRHELEWGYQTSKMMAMSKRERGEVIHNQKNNAVADIAAVLAGAGRGNRMWSRAPPPLEDIEALEAAASEDTEATEEKEQEAEGKTELEATTDGAAETPAGKEGKASSTAVARTDSKPAAKSQKGPLVKANIYWSNNGDLHWARNWTENVEHHIGLPGHVKNRRFKTKFIFDMPEDSAPEEVIKEAENAETTNEAESAETTKGVEPEQEKPEKKGVFGWLGGKSGGSSADARL